MRKACVIARAIDVRTGERRAHASETACAKVPMNEIRKVSIKQAFFTQFAATRAGFATKKQFASAPVIFFGNILGEQARQLRKNFAQASG